jgi:hypothetical protein
VCRDPISHFSARNTTDHVTQRTTPRLSPVKVHRHTASVGGEEHEEAKSRAGGFSNALCSACTRPL